MTRFFVLSKTFPKIQQVFSVTLEKVAGKKKCIQLDPMQVMIYTPQKLTMDTLPETNISPENGWLEYDCFLLGPGLFSGAKWLFSGRVPKMMK